MSSILSRPQCVKCRSLYTGSKLGHGCVCIFVRSQRCSVIRYTMMTTKLHMLPSWLHLEFELCLIRSRYSNCPRWSHEKSHSASSVNMNENKPALWLTYRRPVTHKSVSKLTIIGSDNGLSPGRHQAIIGTSAAMWLVRTLKNKLRWSLNRNSCIFMQGNAFENVVCEMTTILYRPQCVIHHIHYLENTTYWGMNIVTHVSQTTFLNAFSCMKIVIFCSNSTGVCLLVSNFSY